jgi:phospholipase A1/A2
MSSNRCKRLAVALSIGLACLTARGQSPEDLERCRAISDAAARLACYDAAAAAAAKAKPPAAPPASPTPALPAGRPPAEATKAKPVSERVEPGSQLVATGTTEGGQSLIAQRWELEDRYKAGTWRFTFYRPNYILPVVWSDQVNDAPRSPTQPQFDPPGDLDKTEAEFQISFKMKMWEDMFGSDSALWLGYTQRSFWQVYNEPISRPFRETNYEPEFIWTLPTSYDFLGLKGRLLAFGLVHQSNGRADPLSRSWTRIYGMVALERGPLVLQFKPWYRIPESDNKDDNPDIKDYIGRAEFLVFYKWTEQLISTLRLRTTFKSDPSWGSAQLDVRFPITNELRGYVQAFSGYGESMIDYNFRKTTAGLGVSIGTWY